MQIEPAERESLARDLERIIAWVESIREADGDESSQNDAPMRFRPDEPRPSLDREEVARRAPEFADGMFVVPRVIEDA